MKILLLLLKVCNVKKIFWFFVFVVILSLMYGVLRILKGFVNIWLSLKVIEFVSFRYLNCFLLFVEGCVRFKVLEGVR